MAFYRVNVVKTTFSRCFNNMADDDETDDEDYAVSDERRKRRSRRAAAAAEGEEVPATGAGRNREGVK